MTKHRTLIIMMVLALVVLSAIAALSGILSSDGAGPFMHETVRGDIIEIYGKGVYRHMASDVAIQGIAHDYVTLLVGIPMLLISLIYSLKGSLKARLVLTGTIGFYLLTYLFYLMMGMYNELFLVYVSLLSISFFTLIIMLVSFDQQAVMTAFKPNGQVVFPGWFLMVNGALIGLLWLSEVVPPLLDGTLYPAGLGHSTTMVVQGLDLAIMLPLSIVSGWLILKKRPFGYVAAPAYLVFLSVLMTALVAKIIAIAMDGGNVIPVVFIIPTTLLISLYAAIRLLNGFSQDEPE